MYLKGKKYLYGANSEALGKLLQNMHGIKYDISSIEVELGYWRKFNALHAWFIKDEDPNTREVYISEEDILRLVDILRRVSLDHSLAEELLSTESGFFFGSIEYDEYYFDEVNKTLDLMKKLIKENIFKDYELFYSASW